MLDGGFEPTTDDELLTDATTFVICVPTPLSGPRRADLGMRNDTSTR